MRQNVFMSLSITWIGIHLLSVNLCSAQVYEWARAFGGTSGENGSSIAVDSSGNVYTTGVFRGTVDFDPGVGTANLSAAGFSDIFVQKLDASGNFLWAKAFGGTSYDHGNSIAVDASGNVYTTGWFAGTVDFDPGAGTTNLSSAGFEDVFIQKLDASGNFLWAKAFGGTSGNQGNSIAVDASGNVYTTGSFRNTVDFDPGVGTANLSAAGFSDIFVQKLDASGNFLWAKAFGSTSFEVGYGNAVDASGNVYTTGVFRGTVDFDPGGGTTNLSSAGFEDVFIQKLDASGNFLWAKAFGGTDTDAGNSIAVDASGNVYTTGLFRNSVDFDPGAGTVSFSSVGDYDIFVQKLDASGNFFWANAFGSTDFDEGRSIAVDDSGNVFTTGSFRNTVDFDPGAGTANLSAVGLRDIFVQQLDGSGNFLWANAFGSTENDAGYGNAVDASGNVYTTGSFLGSVDFDPGAGTANLSAVGFSDIFVQKMSPCVPTAGIDVQTACDTYTWIDGNTYTTSNSTATLTFMNAVGCDSLVTLNLTINPVYQNSDTLSVCTGEIYTFPDGTVIPNVIVPVTYTSNLSSISGCDSIVTITLMVDSIYSKTEFVEVCEGSGYVFPDGTILQDITTQQVYTSILPTSQGCDSTITTQINVLSVEAELLLINDTLKASLDDATYQWIECGTGQPINGETNQTFFPTQSGEYAVAVTQNGCADTSTCYSLEVTSLNEQLWDGVSVAPTPFDQELIISNSVPFSPVSVRIYDVSGRSFELAYSIEGQTDIRIDGSSLEAGVYFLEVSIRGQQKVFKVFKL